MYCCGPTVYDYTHIGHIRKYVMDDVIKRLLIKAGYRVFHVMNITDVGHLTDDGDEGEDKLEKGSRKKGMGVEELITTYTDFFTDTMDLMNVIVPDASPRATHHIHEMIEMIQVLEAKGYTYQTNQAVYFDVTKFASYGRLSGQNLRDKQQAVRSEVVSDPGKKHPADFALWFNRTGRFANHIMHWDSPWGDGFPGWHIECSAMSLSVMDELMKNNNIPFSPPLTIHTGGIDHIPVHHENEIAQSECYLNKPGVSETDAAYKRFVSIWIHHNFLQVEGEKMSKSQGNFYTLRDFLKGANESEKELKWRRGLESGFRNEDWEVEPEALRLLFLQTHYRQEMNFTFEAAYAAQNAWQRLRSRVARLRTQVEREEATDPGYDTPAITLPDDIQVSQLVAELFRLLKQETYTQEPARLVYNQICQIDEVLGLGLANIQPGISRDTVVDTPDNTIPEEIETLLKDRTTARQNRDFAEADRIRELVRDRGFDILDTPDGAKAVPRE